MFILTNISKKLTIRTKLIIAFSGACLAVFIIGVTAIWSMSITDGYIDEIVHKINPINEKTFEIEKSVVQASQSLGFYLLSKDEVYRVDTDNNLMNSHALLQELIGMPGIQNDSESLTKLTLIQQDLNKLSGYRDVAYKVTASDKDNMPGLKFSNKLVEPISYEIFKLLTHSDQIDSLTVYEIDDVKSLINFWFLIENRLHNFLAFRGADSITQLNQHLSSSMAILESYRPEQEPMTSEEVGTQQNQSMFVRLYELQNVFEERLETLVSLHSSNKWRKDTFLIKSKVGPLVEKIKINLHELTSLQKQHQSELFLKLAERSNTTRYELIVLMLMSMVATGFFSLVFIKLILGKLNKAISAMDDIGEHGNLDRHLEDSDNDEMSLLAKGFNKFVVKIKGVIDLVNSSSTGLANEALLMSEMSDNAKDGVMRQQSEISEVAQAINDMSGIMDGISTDAGLAANAAEQASECAINGHEIVTVSIESTNKLAADVELTQGVIQKLVSEIDDIGSVLEVIKGITDQTNLLALNAAIEAARAGESGRGFAVVADEVRTLSQRTQQETQGIHAKIERLQTEAKSAVNAIEKGKKTAEQNVELVASAGEALKSITQSVETITEMSQKIASTVEAQSHNSTTINSNMVSISQIAAETADVVINASKSNHELSLMAGQLRGMVEQFLFNDVSQVNEDNNDFATTDKNQSINDAVDDALF